MASKLEYTYKLHYYYMQKRRSKDEMGLQSKMRIHDLDRQLYTCSPDRQWAIQTSTVKSNYFRFATITLNFMHNELSNIVDFKLSNLEGGQAAPPLGDGQTPSLTVKARYSLTVLKVPLNPNSINQSSLTVMLANAKFWSFYCNTWYSEYSKWLPLLAFR